MQAYLDGVVKEYQKYQKLGEKAVAQVGNDQELFAVIGGGEDNSIAVLIKHLAGNLRSRWSDLLTTDGEKADRHRDHEFELDAAESRASLLARWAVGFRTVYDTLEKLKPEDLSTTVTIRGEAMPVVQAINRNLAHTAYHVGQIVLLSKHYAGDAWRSLSIPKKAPGV